MKNKTLEFLEYHKSGDNSEFKEKIEWDIKNKSWLEMSRALSLKILEILQEQGKSVENFYDGTGLDPNDKILNGSHDYSLKEIAIIERFLGKKILEIKVHDRERKDQEESNKDVSKDSGFAWSDRIPS